MATNLSELVVKLQAETAQFQKGMEQANKKLEFFGKGATRMVNQVRTAFAALGGALVVREMSNFVKEALDAADRANKFSQQVGVATETITGLELGAKLAGVTMRDVETGLRRLGRAMSDANEGMSSQIRAFEDLQVEYKNSDGTLRSVDDVLRDVADRFAGMEDGARKVARAQELFGRSGSLLIPMLNKGRAGLDSMIDVSRKLGLVWTKEGAAAAEEFNDRLTLIQAVFQGVAADIARDMLPALNEVTSAFLSFATTGKETSVIGTTVGYVIKAIASAAIGASASVQILGKAIAALAAAATSPSLAVDIWRQFQEDFNDIAEKTTAAIDKMFGDDKAKQKGQDLLDFLNGVQSAAGKAPPPAQTKTQKDEQKAFEERVGMVYAYRQAVEGSEEAARAARQESLEQLVDQLGTEEEKIIISYQRRLQMILDNTEANSAIQEELLKRLGEQTAEAMNKLNEKTIEASEVVKQAARNMQDSFAEFLFNPFEDGLQGMLTNFLQTLRRMAAEAAASGIFKAIGGGLVGSGNSVLAGIGAAFGGERAQGGPVNPGLSYLVGERGPEIFTPSIAGRIVPGGSGSGGVMITQNNTFNGTMSPSEVMRLLKQNKDQTKAEVADLIRRGRLT